MMVGDSALVERARAGDRDAFEALVAPHLREMRAHCYRMLGSPHDADDAVQDSLVRAWRGFAGFQERSPLRSWLYRIATNVCLDIVERGKVRTLPWAQSPASNMDDPPAPTGCPRSRCIGATVNDTCLSPSTWCGPKATVSPRSWHSSARAALGRSRCPRLCPPERLVFLRRPVLLMKEET